MNRRDLMTGTAVLAMAGGALAKDEHDHAHHGHDATVQQDLIAATADCVTKGQLCISHCLTLLGQGDKEMAACAKSVNQMLALCGALQSLATQQSAFVPAVAKTTLAVCEACEKECRKHEKKHAECKACADACAQCIRQCRAVGA
jgi:Cys-rich four helix bundle protein (predicted Tat secretion target)